MDAEVVSAGNACCVQTAAGLRNRPTKLIVILSRNPRFDQVVHLEQETVRFSILEPSADLTACRLLRLVGYADPHEPDRVEDARVPRAVDQPHGIFGSS